MEPNNTALSAPALAKKLAPGALSRAGEIVQDAGTDPKVALTAAKLILWACGLEEENDGGGLELRFSMEGPDGN